MSFSEKLVMGITSILAGIFFFVVVRMPHFCSDFSSKSEPQGPPLFSDVQTHSICCAVLDGKFLLYI